MLMNCLEVSKKKLNEETEILKAGVIPYFLNGDIIELYVLKSSNPNFGGPDWQIAKGHVDDGETPIDAAFREGAEELGLKKANFASSKVTSHVVDVEGLKLSYKMMFVAVEVKSKTDFDEPHYETGETKWMSLDEWAKIGRENQREIVLSLMKKV